MAVSRLCSITDCNKRHFGRGYCAAHYKRWQRTGDPLGLRRATPQARAPFCSIGGCVKPHYAFGLCSAHYNRQYRHGSPSGGSTGKGEPMRWLVEHVTHDSDECLRWPYARSGSGEATVWFEGHQRSAAPIMCRLVHGESPSQDHECAHNCGKAHEGCVNPRHLRWATRSENHMDKYLHGTMPIGERSHKHILKAPQVIEIRKRLEKPSVLAKRYGVKVATIYAVLAGLNWAWLE